MRRVLLVASFAFLCVAVLSGCGGHEGGVIDVPLEENPYQVSEQEQRAINSKIDEYAGLSEDEIEELEQAKKQKQKQQQ